MSEHLAFIITDDNEIVGQIATPIKGDSTCEITCSRIGRGPAAFGDFGDSGWVFVDLRENESWSSLDRWVEFRGRRSARLIAIVGNGLPVEQCLTARSAFDATLTSPVCADHVRTLFNGKSPRSEQSSGCAPDQWALTAGDESLVTSTPSLSSLFETIRLVAEREFNVLLVGETGTGKTTLARAIHHLSTRRNRPFINVACGALPSELMDSEMFGHVKGAFTSADSGKEGKFQAADDGTILLDEIDVLGLPQQAKLLRVLESGEFERIGSNDTLKTRVRVIAATNVDLEDLINNRMFRPDLYFRLNQVKIEIPPLRNRRADIAPLTVQFLNECREKQDLDVRYIHPSVFESLESFDWPGNVRELRNEVVRAALFARNGILTPDHLSPKINQCGNRFSAAADESGLASEVALTERVTIERMLRSHNFNRTATARALGISRVTLYNKIRKYRIRVESPRRPPAGD